MITSRRAASGKVLDAETHQIKKPRVVRCQSRCARTPWLTIKVAQARFQNQSSSGDLSPLYNVPVWKRRTVSFWCVFFFFFKSLPSLALISPPSLSAGNFISYFCTTSFYLQICLVHLLRSLKHRGYLEEAIHWWVVGDFSTNLWIWDSKLEMQGAGSPEGLQQPAPGGWSRWIKGGPGVMCTSSC